MALRTALIALTALAVAVPGTAAAARPAASGTAGTAVTPGTAAVTELVRNGDFADGTAGWWNGPNTAVAVTGGALSVSVTGGVNPWDALIGQDGIALAEGTAYTISFDARADAALPVRSTVQLGAEPYTAPHDETINAGTDWRHYSYTFTSTVSTSAGQVTFQLGNGHVYDFGLDNVSLTTGSPQPASGFYVDPDNNAARWVAAHPGHEYADSIAANIAGEAGAKWFGDWSGYGEAEIRASVDAYVDGAEAAGKTPILAAYNIYGRDCGGYSGGGPAAPADYEAWIRGFADGIGDRRAIVILEPDAVAQMLACGMSDADRATREALLSYATARLAAYAPGAWVYLDAGNAGWIDPGVMADALAGVGVAKLRGFAVNVSNYKSTTASDAYARAVNAALPAPKAYVVDTSRNGSADTDGDWCNSRGARLGATSRPGTGGAEFWLWVKFPGDSDGECTHAGHDDPAAGTFVPEFAQALITGDWSGI